MKGLAFSEKFWGGGEGKSESLLRRGSRSSINEWGGVGGGGGGMTRRVEDPCWAHTRGNQTGHCFPQHGACAGLIRRGNQPKLALSGEEKAREGKPNPASVQSRKKKTREMIREARTPRKMAGRNADRHVSKNGFGETEVCCLAGGMVFWSLGGPAPVIQKVWG